VPNKLYKNKNKKNEFLNNGTTSHHARLFGGLSGVGQLVLVSSKLQLALQNVKRVDSSDQPRFATPYLLTSNY
jgi:hypothetical protein